MEEKKEQAKLVTDGEYHRVTSKLFYNSLLNIPLFAVPAFGALFLGKYLDARFGTGKTWVLVLLFLALAFSWYVVLRKNTRLTQEYKDVRKKMKEEAEQKLSENQ